MLIQPTQPWPSLCPPCTLLSSSVEWVSGTPFSEVWATPGWQQVALAVSTVRSDGTACSGLHLPGAPGPAGCQVLGWTSQTSESGKKASMQGSHLRSSREVLGQAGELLGHVPRIPPKPQFFFR